MKEGDKVRLKFGRTIPPVYAMGETGVINEIYSENCIYFCSVMLDDNIEAFEQKYGEHLKVLGYTLSSQMPKNLLTGIKNRCYCFCREEIEPV